MASRREALAALIPWAAALRAAEDGRFLHGGAHWRLTPLAPAGPISYFIDEPEARFGCRPGDRQLAEWALAAWDRALDGLLCFSPSEALSAQVRVYWGMTGDRLGLMKAIEFGERRGAEVYVEARPGRVLPALGEACDADPLFRDAYVYRTLLHEIGHALGLDHSLGGDDAMYFGGDPLGFYRGYRAKLASRDDIQRTPGLSTTDIELARALYPLEAAFPPKPPRPPGKRPNGRG